MVGIRHFLNSQLFVKLPPPTASFKDQVAIVTGSNTGLGKDAAEHITRLGAAKVILAVRNLEAGEAAKRMIESNTGRSGIVEVWKLDLSSFDSVKDFAKKAAQLPRLDVLLENAGISTAKFALSEGYESSVTINVISTFLLGLMLLPKLKATAKEFNTNSHLSIVSSETHMWAKLPELTAANTFDALSDASQEDMGGNRYMVTKLMEVLVIRHIAPKIQGTGTVLNMINPGLCRTEIARNASGATHVMMRLMHLLLARTSEEGSRNLVAAAAAGPETNGMYFDNCVANDQAMGPWIRGEEAARAGEKLWSELAVILNRVEPGVVSNL